MLIWPLLFILVQKFVKFFFGFLENLRLSNRHSEINWPLAEPCARTHGTQSLCAAFRIHHGQRTPNKAFFYWNSKPFDLGRQFGQINFRVFWGIFGQFISTHFCPCFPIIQQFYKKKPRPYIQIPNIYVFGIWIWAA